MTSLIKKNGSFFSCINTNNDRHQQCFQHTDWYYEGKTKKQNDYESTNEKRNTTSKDAEIYTNVYAQCVCVKIYKLAEVATTRVFRECWI